MAHLLQVGVGSGGMAVLDAVVRHPRITHVTLIDPDVYKPHNVERHLFATADIGEFKGLLAERWLADRRPDLTIDVRLFDVLDPAIQRKSRKLSLSATSAYAPPTTNR